ncbi:hypothetical protein L6164_014312 [Bauhinia variegata]|uniref:Uncharacterized protein n=1 Tax=Bauhinia variegata TaxID=167791 RepID=A0ACB9NI38_BAUVA|nr:hypothetical protein L6164_014312 [Bauhinia variegata]
MESKELVKLQPKKNLWKPEEDLVLKAYIETHGEGKWATVSKNSGLKRGGKSCRLRWKNYLRPDIKRGDMSQEEEDLIIRLHKLLGNRWSLIAGRLPGRTDNEVKNHWNTHLNKRSHRGKKRIIDSNNDKESNKKIRACNNSEETCRLSSTSIAETGLDVMEKEKEEKEESSSMTNSWMDETQSFDCDLDCPILPANSAVLGFEDETFNLEPFISLEALGCGTMDCDSHLRWIMP